MELLVVYSLLTSAAFYLGSRALITGWLWSRYPRRLATFMDCAACTGFWYGALANVLMRDDTWWLSQWWSPILVGLCSIVTTPIVAGLAHNALMNLGDATPEEPSA